MASAANPFSCTTLRSAPTRNPFLSSRRLSVLSFPLSFTWFSHRHHKPSPPPTPIRSQQAQQEAGADLDPSLLPHALREIVSLFQSVSDPKAKYQQLLHYGSRMPPLDPQYKTDDHRVRGCVSQVWVRAFPDPADPAAVCFEADSDSALTKGLAALLVLGLSGSPAPAIARVPPEFVHLLGLRQSLTPSRNNGFLNMLKLMQLKALQIYAGVDAEPSSPQNTPPQENPNSNPAVDAPPPPSSSGGNGGRSARIKEKLQAALAPSELEVEDVSYQHAGHAAVRGSGDGETHFNLKIVSEEFQGKSLVKRHRLVYDLLQEELASGLHALSIVAKTPLEVAAK